MTALTPPQPNQLQFGIVSKADKGLRCSWAKNAFEETLKESEGHSEHR